MSMYDFMVPSNASGLEFTAVTVGKFQLRVGGPRVALACLFVAAFVQAMSVSNSPRRCSWTHHRPDCALRSRLDNTEKYFASFTSVFFPLLSPTSLTLAIVFFVFRCMNRT